MPVKHYKIKAQNRLGVWHNINNLTPAHVDKEMSSHAFVFSLCGCRLVVSMMHLTLRFMGNYPFLCMFVIKKKTECQLFCMVCQLSVWFKHIHYSHTSGLGIAFCFFNLQSFSELLRLFSLPRRSCSDWFWLKASL